MNEEGTSLVAQWQDSFWGLGGAGLVPGGGTSPSVLQLRVSMLGFPGSSVDKESACSAVDPGSIPGLGRSAREGTGYPLQYSWPSLVAQLVKNLPEMWETWV